MMRREREITDVAEILDILNRASVVHLGLCDGDQPYVVPMNYGYVFEDGRLTLYLHGARKGYKYDVMTKNPKVSFEMECDVEQIPGDVACRYGTSYSCVMGRGTAALVTDAEEKCRALNIFMKTQTGKDFEFTEKLVSVVNVIRVDAADFTAKRRPKPVK